MKNITYLFHDYFSVRARPLLLIVQNYYLKRALLLTLANFLDGKLVNHLHHMYITSKCHKNIFTRPLQYNLLIFAPVWQIISPPSGNTIYFKQTLGGLFFPQRIQVQMLYLKNSPGPLPLARIYNVRILTVSVNLPNSLIFSLPLSLSVAAVIKGRASSAC